jgi:DNA polymerase-3 subunit alpha
MIHLNAKTGFSFLKGFGEAGAWHDRCKEIGAPALGIADFCSTWGHVPFKHAFKEVKLLYGVSLPVVDQLTKNPVFATCVLLAKNDLGLQKLYALLGTAYNQKYYFPRVTWRQLGELRGAIEVIAVEGSLGDLGDFAKLKFGYIGIGPHSSRSIVAAARELPAVALASPCYPRTEDRAAFDLIRRVGQGEAVSETHLLREDELRALMPDAPDKWFKQSQIIADECSATICAGTFIKPKGKRNLEREAQAGLVARGLAGHPDYQKRLTTELKTIFEKQFEDYFIVVSDLVRWAKKTMFVGPGRGSVGGSLVAYALGITEVDPIRFGTLFERFIDITRNDWPDIDMDFPDSRREEVFDYLKETYGAEKVARLGTISRFGGRSAINDTAKAFGIKWDVARECGKWLDHGEAIAPTLEIEQLRPLVEANPKIRLAALIDDHPRHHGKHAAGVVIANGPVSQYGTITDEDIVCFDMKDAEKIGLIKMDVLGLRTLAVIQECCDLVGIDAKSLYSLSWDDPKVFDLFNRNAVTGVFQFEGAAVRGLMRRIRVETFDDLSALTSLARPGPLVGGAAELWVQRRSGEQQWEYAHPALEPHTKNTFGTIVYQEQAMSIVREIGGFTIPQVNGFRRAVGKKDPVALATYREPWMKHAPSIVGEKLAAELWDEMCEFGSYAFNLAHAVAYSMISYMAAHLKVHYSVDFALAQLRNEKDEDKSKALLRELQNEGHKFVPFDPQRSQKEWSVQDGVLYGGFTGVKGIGEKTANALIDAREVGGADWLTKITDAQRTKLISDRNTPWHEINRLGQQYAELYANPETFKGYGIKSGVSGPVMKIAEIPDLKGNYCFIGVLRKRMLKTKMDADGKPAGRNPTYLNMIFEDDTGEMGATINRRLYPSLGAPLMDENTEGRDFILRGSILDNGRKWLFIENIKELRNVEES